MARKESAIANRRIASGLFEPTDNPAPRPSKPTRVKRTFHLDEDAAFILEDMQSRRFRETKVKPELSALVSEAIRLLDSSEHPDAKAS